MTRKTNSFTLVEIIAVLLIIAIMAAVAAPKFINLADDAKAAAAQAGINEAKATLSVAYAQAYLKGGGAAVTGQNVLDYAFGDGTAGSFTSGDQVMMGEIPVVLTVAANVITLNATYDGVAADAGTWTVPTFVVSTP